MLKCFTYEILQFESERKADESIWVSIAIAYIGNKGVENSQASSISANLFDFDVMSRYTYKSALSDACHGDYLTVSCT